MDEDQALTQTSLMDTDKDKLTITSIDTKRKFKLIRGKNGSATFLLFSQRIGRNVRKIGNINNITQNVECLMPKQIKYVYKKVELGSLINKETIKEEIDLDMELDRVDNDSQDENPYKELIVNNAIKVENALSQMEQWLILSHIINYVQYRKNPKRLLHYDC